MIFKELRLVIVGVTVSIVNTDASELLSKAEAFIFTDVIEELLCVSERYML